ncbi:MAG: DNA-protecting protein DprA [Anaerolineales bacterium]|nr:DNA-protecting protein DprA [Anaerolineales bacterium]
MFTYHLNLLTLLELNSVGRRTVQQLLLSCDRTLFSEQPLHAKSEILRFLFRLPGDQELARARKQADAIVDHAHKAGVQLIGFGEDRYPQRLAALSDFPVILFIRGNPEALQQQKTISIIGSRTASPKVLQLTETYARRLAEKGWYLVSGLTEGCEAAAHRGTLQAARPGTAVLGSGLDQIHPRRSTRLAKEILEKGGCWISEHPNGTSARKRRLIERDRIRSALSAGVLLIQASFSSHAMHTVRLAKSQGSPLDVLDPSHAAISGDSTGNNFLVKARAAVPIQSNADLESYIENLSRQLAAPDIKTVSNIQPLADPVQLRLWEER